jgi:hypothetical protein
VRSAQTYHDNMDEIVVPSRSEEQPLFQQMMSQFGGPAFLRRAHRTEATLTALRAKLALTRSDWLGMVKMRLATLHGLAGDWSNLRPRLDAAEVEALARLHAELRPTLRLPTAPTANAGTLWTGVIELSESLQRFNRRWLKLIQGTDLSEVNRRRDEYNRYYVLEKECALGSARIARHGFRPLPPVTTAALLAWFPLLVELSTI